MNPGFKTWSIALPLSVMVHLALVVGFKPPTDGFKEPPAGASVSVEASLASIMGQMTPNAAEVESNDTTTVEPTSQARPIKPREMTDVRVAKLQETQALEKTPVVDPSEIASQPPEQKPVPQATPRDVDARTAVESKPVDPNRQEQTSPDITREMSSVEAPPAEARSVTELSVAAVRNEDAAPIEELDAARNSADAPTPEPANSPDETVAPNADAAVAPNETVTPVTEVEATRNDEVAPTAEPATVADESVAPSADQAETPNETETPVTEIDVARTDEATPVVEPDATPNEDAVSAEVLEAAENVETAAVATDVVAEPAATEAQTVDVAPTPTEAVKTKTTPKKKKSKKRAARTPPGTNQQSSAGKRKAGKKGKARASSGAILSYASRVRARIAGNRPRSVGRGRVVVSFGLTASGGLRYARIARSSGNAGVDRAALSAVRRSSPFPRPPKGASSGQLRFSIPFSFR